MIETLKKILPRCTIHTNGWFTIPLTKSWMIRIWQRMCYKRYFCTLQKIFLKFIEKTVTNSLLISLVVVEAVHTVSIPQLARTIPLKGLNLSLEKYRMPDGVIIEVESSSHYLGSFSEKNDSSTNWIEKIMEGVGIH